MRSVDSLWPPWRPWLTWTSPKRMPLQTRRYALPSARAVSAAVTVLAVLAILATFLVEGRYETSSDLAGAATLTVVSGAAEVRPVGAAAFSMALDGQTLRAGDSIRTDSKGRVIVTYFEGSSATIGPSTTSVIGRLRVTAQREPTMAAAPEPAPSPVATESAAGASTWRLVSHLLGWGIATV